MDTVVAILGRQPEISAAELASRMSPDRVTISTLCREAVQIQGEHLDAAWFHRFGGMVKLGRVVDTVPSLSALTAVFSRSVLAQALTGPGKRVFGISAYGFPTQPDLHVLVKRIKLGLKAQGISSRYVRSTTGQISSVVVQKQGLLRHGAELLFIKTSSGITIAQTSAVHAFEDFADRDFGRPASNARSGMLPPKLARILVHLALVEEDATLLDPFCGSGTILQEAALLGICSLIGSDTAPRAIRETKENLAWLSTRIQHPMPSVRLLQQDVRQLLHAITPASVDAIVTEPYLGPPLHGNESATRIKIMQHELAALYEGAFAVFARLLKPGGRLVFLLPVFLQLRGAERFMHIDRLLTDFGFHLCQPLPPGLVPWYVRDLTFRHTLLYQRQGQRVGREIVLLQKTEQGAPS